MNDDMDSKTVSSLSDATSVVPSAVAETSSAEPPQRKSLFSQEWKATESDDVTQYSRISVAALCAVMCGLASLLGFLYFFCVFFSLPGIVLGLVAYVSVARSQGSLTGAGAALTGLGLSLIALFAIVASWSYYDYTLRLQADRFGKIWFETIKRRDLKTAREMYKATWHRRHELSEKQWWREELKDDGPMSEARNMFVSALNDKAWKTLWNLGKQAQITYFKTDAFYRFDGRKNGVALIYAVTFHDELGEKKTFFIRLYLERVHHPQDNGRLGWMVVGVKQVARPVELGGKPPEEKSGRY